MSSNTKEQAQLQSSAATTTQKPTKTFIDEFGDKVIIDNITYLECVIARKRGVTFKWIRDIDNVSYKVILNDQDFG